MDFTENPTREAQQEALVLPGGASCNARTRQDTCGAGWIMSVNVNESARSWQKTTCHSLAGLDHIGYGARSAALPRSPDRIGYRSPLGI